MKTELLALATASLLTPCLIAQINPAVGAPQGAGDDTVVGPLTLSFSYKMPDGSMATDLFADSNGRVFADGGEGSDFSESLAEFSSDPTQIAVYWDDLNPGGGAGIGDVYFNDLGTSALITWLDVTVFGAPAGDEFTVQVELFPDGSFELRSDSRTPAGDCIIGSSVGGGAALPASTDITMSAPFDSGLEATVFELFDGGASPYDLVDSDTTFTRNVDCGYMVTTSAIGNPCPGPAVVTLGPPACVDEPFCLTFTPDGLGGYDSSIAGVTDLDFASGTALGLGDDAAATAALGFTFSMPGGSMVTEVDVDSNGRLFEVGAEASDFSESVGELLGDPTAIIAPFWDDLNPSAAGEVWVHNAASGAVSITWDAVPEFGTATSNTFQAQLFPSGVISFHYLAMAATDGIVGLSSGNGATDPLESDLSAGPVMTTGGPVVYEQFTGDFDLLGALVFPTLTILNDPLIGEFFDQAVADNAGSMMDFYILGNPMAPLDLGSVGIPCSLEVDGIFGTFSTAPSAGLSFMIPDSCACVGVMLRTQGATFSPSATPAILMTNSLDFTVGSL
ncbi:MAG: hypothetical protein AAF196_20595 [Planctomycetota bacterium]